MGFLRQVPPWIMQAREGEVVRVWDKGIGVASFHKFGKMGDDLGTTLEMLPNNPPYFDLKFDIRWRQLNVATLYRAQMDVST